MIPDVSVLPDQGVYIGSLKLGAQPTDIQQQSQQAFPVFCLAAVPPEPSPCVVVGQVIGVVPLCKESAVYRGGVAQPRCQCRADRTMQINGVALAVPTHD